MSDIWKWDATTTALRVKAGEVSAVEVVDAHLARLDAVNPGVNAVTFDVSDEARAAAIAADVRQASGAPTGPLHGVPITIKENIDVAGQPTPNGLPVLADTLAVENSPLVNHMLNAGAIIVGRTNTPEFSYRWHTDNPLRGETKNPWTSERTPGGSSGGAASSLALGIGAIAHGNDLGGSLRYPAYCCGLTTIRPTLGRVPSWNSTTPVERTMSLQVMSTQGPIARNVRDARLGLTVMAQPDPHDPWHVPLPVTGPRVTGPIKVAVTYGPVGTPPAPEVKAAVDQAAAHLADAGYIVEHIDPPNIDLMVERWAQLLWAETRTGIDFMRQIGSTDLMNALDWQMNAFDQLDMAGYVSALAERSAHLRAWSMFMTEHPLVLSPVSQELPFTPGDDVSSEERLLEIFPTQTMLIVMNYLGLPAAAVPTGMAGDGPVGVQIAGPRFREDLCLDGAAAIEERVGPIVPILWERT
jgi:amidase